MGQHPLGGMVRHQERAVGRYQERVFDLFGIEVRNRAAGPSTRVVDRNGEIAAGRIDLIEEAFHLGRLARVAIEEIGPRFLC